MALKWPRGFRELLFGSTTGLELDEARIGLDLDHSYYNYRFVRHNAEGDLVANPGFLWSANAYWKQRGGLEQHLLQEARALEGMVYNDVLLILSEPDWRKTQARVITPWDDSVLELLTEKFEALVAKNRLLPIAPERGLQLRILFDGAMGKGGEQFGLAEGEFITCVLPHLYHGPVPSSRVLAEIYVHFPDWRGEFRKIGALYSDQLGFSIGNHWLDSYQATELEEPALYLLHHFPGTPRLEHRINPDALERFRLGTVEKGPHGEDIQPLVLREDPRKVLEVLLVRPLEVKLEAGADGGTGARIDRGTRAGVKGGTGAGAEGEARESLEVLQGPGVEADGMAEVREPLEAKQWERSETASDPDATGALEVKPWEVDEAEGVLPPERDGSGGDGKSVQDGEALGGAGASAPGESVSGPGRPASKPPHYRGRIGDTLPGEVPAGTRVTLTRDSSLGGRTIIPERFDLDMLKLVDAGMLVQKVHFPNLMAGYTINLGTNGHVGSGVRRPFSRIRVQGRRVWVDVLEPDVFVDRKKRENGEAVEITEGVHHIVRGAATFEYRAMRAPTEVSWPYLGEIRRPLTTRHLPAGARYKIGRNRQTCKIPLPDDSDQSNIIWQPRLADTKTEKGAHGEIDRAMLRTDSIMVAGEHAELDWGSPTPILKNISARTLVYVRRGGDQYRKLKPGKGGAGEALELVSGDELLIGNNLFGVSFQARGPDGDSERLGSPGSVALRIHGAGDGVTERRNTSTPTGQLSMPGPSGQQYASSATAPMGPAPVRPVVDLRPPGPSGGAGTGAGKRASDGRGSSVRPGSPTSSHEGQVVARDEGTWSMEIRRPGRMVQVGWSVTGRVRAGNHNLADLIVPENRINRDQSFLARDYFTAYVRDNYAQVVRLPNADAVLLSRSESVEATENLRDLRILVHRRDPLGRIDFTVTLTFPDDGPSLPRPRARLLAILADPFSAGLFTWGLPSNVPGPLELGSFKFKALWTSEGARLEDYLESYRRPDGSFREFYWLDGDVYRTPPEDGRPLVLSPGTLLVLEHLVFRLEG